MPSRPLPAAPPIRGLHHVTAIARDPQRNVDFYAGLLGLRLVKRTVNFDDPSTYHLYYGNERGEPGTLLTFFPWELARRGTVGSGQATRTTLAIPPGALGFWADRLRAAGVSPAEVGDSGAAALRFADPDGLPLALVARDRGLAPWVGGSVPERMAVRGIDSVTLSERDAAAAAAFLQRVLGFRPVVGAPGRLAIGDGGSGAEIEIVDGRADAPGRVSAGTVHHVAFRVADDAAQTTWRARLAAAGEQPTDVQDRRYFKSIYFREPGGVLLELATDPPGFAVDEPAGDLGHALQLPPWLERARPHIQAMLPVLELPRATEVVS